MARDDTTHALSNDTHDVILDSISEGVFTVDENWQITYFNRAAERITGVSREEALGRQCSEVFRASVCEEGCVLREAIEAGRSVSNRVVQIVNSQGEQLPIGIDATPLRDEQGRVTGGIETLRDLTLTANLRESLEHSNPLEEIVSRNDKMRRLFEILPTIAASESTVLIEGESGTGKELFARAIRQLSPRNARPMITVNCGALPDTLLESELFGHVAGAFTDARRERVGRFEEAEGGTLFLDEIGDVSPALQVRLLRVLQEGTYQPLGSNETRTSDVRVIAATNKPLQELVKTGEFRQDLYYRINVVRLQLPPLRDRKEDIPLLIEHFVQKFNARRNREITGVSPAVMRMLSSYEFPGNVRELENVVEHAFVLCPGGIIHLEHLPEDVRTPIHEDDEDPKGIVHRAQAEFLLKALRKNNWHRGKTARELGFHPTTLWRKLKKLGVRLPAEDGRSAREAD